MIDTALINVFGFIVCQILEMSEDAKYTKFSFSGMFNVFIVDHNLQYFINNHILYRSKGWG